MATEIARSEFASRVRELALDAGKDASDFDFQSVKPFIEDIDSIIESLPSIKKPKKSSVVKKNAEKSESKPVEKSE